MRISTCLPLLKCDQEVPTAQHFPFLTSMFTTIRHIHLPCMQSGRFIYFNFFMPVLRFPIPVCMTTSFWTCSPCRCKPFFTFCFSYSVPTDVAIFYRVHYPYHHSLWVLDTTGTTTAFFAFKREQEVFFTLIHCCCMWYGIQMGCVMVGVSRVTFVLSNAV